MKTIIYCASWERGEEQFNKYVEAALKEGEEHFRIQKSRRGSRLTHLPTGDVWQVVYAYDGARGHKWDFCEVDEEISLKTYREIILPSTIHPRSEIERRVTFF